MARSLANPYTVRPDELKPGDVMAVVVTAHMMGDGSFQLYRCPYPVGESEYEGIPQGDRVLWSLERLVATALFPAVLFAEELRATEKEADDNG